MTAAATTQTRAAPRHSERQKGRTMMWQGDHGELFMLVRKGPRPMPVRYGLVCFGTKRHYRKDGGCKHTAAVLAVLKPWHQARADVVPRGNSDG